MAIHSLEQVVRVGGPFYVRDETRVDEDRRERVRHLDGELRLFGGREHEKNVTNGRVVVLGGDRVLEPGER